jgi:hypothetical protein
VGGIALIAVAGFVLFFWLRLRSKREKEMLDKLSATQQALPHESYQTYHDNSCNELDTQEPMYQLGTETTRPAEMGGEHGLANQRLMELDAHR